MIKKPNQTKFNNNEDQHFNSIKYKFYITLLVLFFHYITFCLLVQRALPSFEFLSVYVAFIQGYYTFFPLCEDIIDDPLQRTFMISFACFRTTPALIISGFIVLDFIFIAICSSLFLLSHFQVDVLIRYAPFNIAAFLLLSTYLFPIINRNKIIAFRQLVYDYFSEFLTSVYTNTTDKVLKDVKFYNYFLYFNIFCAFIMSFLLLPVFGDESYIFAPIAAFDEIFSNHYSFWYFSYFLFYCLVFHSSFVMMTSSTILVSAMLSIKFVLYECQEILRDISVHRNDFALLDDEEYQKEVFRKLIKCIQVHQKMTDYRRQLGNFLNYPILLFCGSAAILGLSDLCFIWFEISPASNLRFAYLLYLHFLILVLFGSCGQSLSDESEILYNIIQHLPWYLWNKANCKLLSIFLIYTREPLVIGSINNFFTVDHTLILKVNQFIYSAFAMIENLE